MFSNIFEGNFMTYCVLTYSTLTPARSRNTDRMDTHDDGIILKWEDNTFTHNIFQEDSAGKRTGNISKTLSGVFKEYPTKKEADSHKNAINAAIKLLKETFFG